MTSGDDLYAILGVDPSATAGDIAEGYARLSPPDAAARDSYDILADPVRRTGYDAIRRARREAASAAEASRHHAPPGSSEVELELSFDQAALGTTATVHVETSASCATCIGAGALPGADCGDCHGSGSHTRTSGGIKIRAECRTCEGAGRAAPTACGTCAGRGVIDTARAVTIRVPPGVDDGARLRFNLPDEAQRVAVVRVAPHPYFTRRGRNIDVKVPITLAEAALGGVVTVPTLGGAVAVRIPPGTPPGRTFRVRGRGIATPSGAGDLLATVEVVIPNDLNDDQRRALELFAAATESPRQHFRQPTKDTPDAP